MALSYNFVQHHFKMLPVLLNITGAQQKEAEMPFVDKFHLEDVRCISVTFFQMPSLVGNENGH